MKHLAILFALVMSLLVVPSQGLLAQDTDTLAVGGNSGARVRDKDQGLGLTNAGRLFSYAAAGGCILTGALVARLMLSDKSGYDIDGNLRIDLGAILLKIAVETAGSLSLASGITGLTMYGAGRAKMNSDDYWADARFNGPSQRRWSLIVEPDVSFGINNTSLTAPSMELGLCITGGYHFNEHWFVGASATPSWGRSFLGSFFMPIAANVRYSILDRIYTPYLGISPGYDVIAGTPCLSMDLGLRIRLVKESSQSMWIALTGEVQRGFYNQQTFAFEPHYRGGLKLGWSF